MKPEKFSYVDETLFTVIDSIPSVTVDGTSYDVTILNKPDDEQSEDGEDIPFDAENAEEPTE